MLKKKWYLSRTLWANALFFAAGLTAVVLQEVELSANASQWIIVLQAAFNLLLRIVTDKGLEF